MLFFKGVHFQDEVVDGDEDAFTRIEELSTDF
jgi:hypothetical protein